LLGGHQNFEALAVRVDRRPAGWARRGFRVRILERLDDRQRTYCTAFAARKGCHFYLLFRFLVFLRPVIERRRSKNDLKSPAK
jgi:hypothetical protein